MANTASAPTPPTSAPEPPTSKTASSKSKKKTAPIRLAERSVAKQIREIEKSSLPDGQKQQMIDWLNGLVDTMSNFKLAMNHESPPTSDSIHGKLITTGRSQRELDAVLAGADEGSGSDQGGPAAPAAADVGV